MGGGDGGGAGGSGEGGGKAGGGEGGGGGGGRGGGGEGGGLGEGGGEGPSGGEGGAAGVKRGRSGGGGDGGGGEGGRGGASAVTSTVSVEAMRTSSPWYTKEVPKSVVKRMGVRPLDEIWESVPATTVVDEKRTSCVPDGMDDRMP